jgi:hypothetical protein
MVASPLSLGFVVVRSDRTAVPISSVAAEEGLALLRLNGDVFWTMTMGARTLADVPSVALSKSYDLGLPS